VISILGGEPTLHPDLPAIIRYIADKGVTVKILSNGLILNDELLKTYKEAGLSVVMLHIDSKQNRPDLPPNPTQSEVNELRDRLLGMVERHGFVCELAITLYKSTLDRFADDVEYVLSSRTINKMLILRHSSVFQGSHLVEKFLPCNEETKELTEWVNAGESEETTITVEDIEDVMRDNFSLLPTMYISSNKNINEKRWIFYFAHSIRHKDGSYTVVPFDNRTIKYLMSAYQRVHKLLYGKYSFFGRVNALNGQRSFAIFEALFSLNPALIAKTLVSVAASFKDGAVFTDKVLVIQFPPNLTTEGTLEYCNSCYDATVRNGRLLPVCIADMVSPVDLNERSKEVKQGYDRLLAHFDVNL
jgi:organic radical activating enzyme